MQLKNLIKIADSHYPDGLLGLYYHKPGRDYGDGLARFIAAELASTYSPHADTEAQLKEAIRAMRTASREVQTVIDALEIEYDKQTAV